MRKVTNAIDLLDNKTETIRVSSWRDRPLTKADSLLLGEELAERTAQFKKSGDVVTAIERLMARRFAVWQLRRGRYPEGDRPSDQFVSAAACMPLILLLA